LPVGITDLSDSEDWVMVPESDSVSIETNTSLKCNADSPIMHKSDTFDSQTELTELALDGEESVEPSSTAKRYSSPLFKELLPTPIEPVKIAKTAILEETLVVTGVDGAFGEPVTESAILEKSGKSPATILELVKSTEPLEKTVKPVNVLEESVKVAKPEAIPEDKSINVLLHAASLVSKSHKTPKITQEDILKLTLNTNQVTGVTNFEKIQHESEDFDENFSKTFSAEKRPSVNDPEQVLMKNVVPGEIDGNLSPTAHLQSVI
jgi:hypothetical protein